MIQHILYQRVAGVQNQGLSLLAEHSHIHPLHGIHFHHILHSAAFLGQRDHGRDLLVLQFFDLYFDGIFLENFLHQPGNCLCLLFHFLFGFLGSLCFKDIGQVRIDSLEFDSFILRFQL